MISINQNSFENSYVNQHQGELQNLNNVNVSEIIEKQNEEKQNEEKKNEDKQNEENQEKGMQNQQIKNQNDPEIKDKDSKEKQENVVQNQQMNRQQSGSQDKQTEYDSDIKIKENAIEIIGFLLGLVDQVSDIIVVFNNSYVKFELWISAIVILVVNFFLINFFCFFRVIYTSSKPTIQVEIKNKKITSLLFISDRIIWIFFEILKKIFIIIHLIINQALAVFIIWFGFNKLILINIQIQHFMEGIFLRENENLEVKKQNEVIPITKKENEQIQAPSTQNKNKIRRMNTIKSKKQQLVDFQLLLELIEKIFENIPQLILQLINQSIGGSQNQTLNIISITSSVLNIIFNIFSVAKMQNKEIQSWYSNLTQAVSDEFFEIKDKIETWCSDIPDKIRDMIWNLGSFWDDMKSNRKEIRKVLFGISYLIQFTIFILIVISYKWNNYADYKSQSYGKDTDDSVRTFIVLYPLAFLIFSGIFCLPYLDDFYIYDDNNITHVFQASWLVKDLVLFQFFVDALAFHPENFDYGKELLGDVGFISFSVLVFLSILNSWMEQYCANLFKWWKQSEWKWKEYRFSLFNLQLFLYFFIKSIQQLINFAQYYSWKDGSCSSSLDIFIKAYLIIYLFRFLLPILQLVFLSRFDSVYDAEISQFSIFHWLTFSILYLGQVPSLIINSFLLHTIINEVPCGDLLFVQKHPYNQIYEVVFDSLLLIETIYILCIFFYEIHEQSTFHAFPIPRFYASLIEKMGGGSFNNCDHKI